MGAVVVYIEENKINSINFKNKPICRGLSLVNDTDLDNI